MRTRARDWIPTGFLGLGLGLGLGLVLALGGCGKSSKKSSNKSTSKKGATARSIPKQVGVKLLTPGSGPKQRLRYRFRAPETHQVVITIAMSVGVTTQERSVPVQKMPDMQMHLTLEHRSVSPTGVLKYSFTLTRAGLAGGGEGAMKKRFEKVLGPALQQLVGLTGSGEVTARGVAKHAELRLPSGIPGPARKALQSLQEQIQQLATPLPEQAVGVGAQWEVVRPLARATLRLGQSAKYTLVKRQGARVTFEMRLEQYAPEQELKSSQLPHGAKAQLHSLTSKGKGRFDIDLTRPVPSGDLRYDSRLDQTVSAGGKSRRMQLDLNVHARFSPR